MHTGLHPRAAISGDVVERVETFEDLLVLASPACAADDDPLVLALSRLPMRELTEACSSANTLKASHSPSSFDSPPKTAVIVGKRGRFAHFGGC